MLKQQDILIYRSIKKSAIVLILLQHLSRPASARELSAMLDLSPKTIKERLTSLQALGLIRATAEGSAFTLTENAIRLLYANFKGGKNFPSSSGVKSLKRDSRGINLILQDKAGENSTGGKRRKEDDHSAASQGEGGGAARADPIEEVIQALKKAGIRNPMRNKLARIPHLTVKHITRYEEQLKREAGERYTPGLLIYTLQRVQPNDPPPPCTCGVCSECLARYHKYAASPDDFNV